MDIIEQERQDAARSQAADDVATAIDAYYAASAPTPAPTPAPGTSSIPGAALDVVPPTQPMPPAPPTPAMPAPILMRSPDDERASGGAINQSGMPANVTALRTISNEQAQPVTPARSLAELRAVIAGDVEVYPEMPGRLRVKYMPAIAKDPLVATEQLRIIAQINNLNTTGVRAGLQNEADGAGPAHNEAQELVTFTDRINHMVEALYRDTAKYITTVCNGWTLDDPFTMEYLLDPQNRWVILDIFRAVNNLEQSGNLPG